MKCVRPGLWSAMAAVAFLAGCGQGQIQDQLPAGADTFDVPTYDWGRDGGLEASIDGHLAFTDNGCTMVYQPGVEHSARPVMFPDAVGVRYSNGVRAVVRQDDGGLYAVEGQSFAYGGGWGEPSRPGPHRAGTMKATRSPQSTTIRLTRRSPAIHRHRPR